MVVFVLSRSWVLSVPSPVSNIYSPRRREGSRCLRLYLEWEGYVWGEERKKTCVSLWSYLYVYTYVYVVSDGFYEGLRFTSGLFRVLSLDSVSYSSTGTVKSFLTSTLRDI